MKVGDRVKVILEISTFYGKVGTIIREPTNHIAAVAFEDFESKGAYAFGLDSLERVPKNTLIVIGQIGWKQCYLNLSREEAARRYAEKENQGRHPEMFITAEDVLREETIEEFTFDDEFSAYDTWQ